MPRRGKRQLRSLSPASRPPPSTGGWGDPAKVGSSAEASDSTGDSEETARFFGARAGAASVDGVLAAGFRDAERGLAAGDEPGALACGMTGFSGTGFVLAERSFAVAEAEAAALDAAAFTVGDFVVDGFVVDGFGAAGLDAAGLVPPFTAGVFDADALGPADFGAAARDADGFAAARDADFAAALTADGLFAAAAFFAAAFCAGGAISSGTAASTRNAATSSLACFVVTTTRANS